MRMQLQRAGHEVITAIMAVAACGTLTSPAPTSRAPDIRMPELDGWATLEAGGQLSRMSRSRSSAGRTRSPRSRRLRLGLDAFDLKPVSGPEQLTYLVEELLAGARVKASPTP